MILTIDIGNSALSFKFESSKTAYTVLLSIKKAKNQKDIDSFLKNFLTDKNIDPKYVKDIVICSVVDSTKEILVKSLNKIFNAKIRCLIWNKQNIIKIKIDTPEKLGADMIATAIGAAEKYKNDICIIDLGTASTISVINRKKEFLAYNIMPGIKIQFESLANETFKLPEVKPKHSKDILGKNTQDAILSGVLRGHANSINHFINQINTSFPDLTIILTGGFSQYVRNYLTFNHKFYPDIIHDGLKKLIK